jgi:hypothetical protein
MERGVLGAGNTIGLDEGFGAWGLNLGFRRTGLDGSIDHEFMTYD